MHKLCSHQYFMDEMSIPDLNIMTKYIEFADVVSWNQARNIMLSSLRPYLKKKNLTVDEFLPLPVDENWQAKEKLTTEVDQKDIEWFRKYKEQYKKDSK